MRDFLALHDREILIGGCVLVFVILFVGIILNQYFKDKRGPWTL